MLRAITKVSFITRQGQKLYWIPEAHYPEGFFGDISGNHAVGRQVIQPWVIDDTGTKTRLDDVLQGRWTLLHVGALPACAHAWVQRGVLSVPVRDTTLTAWFNQNKASAVIVRPDGFIYTATDSTGSLAPPPAGLDCAAHVVSIPKGVPA